MVVIALEASLNPVRISPVLHHRLINSQGNMRMHQGYRTTYKYTTTHNSSLRLAFLWLTLQKSLFMSCIWMGEILMTSIFVHVVACLSKRLLKWVGVVKMKCRQHVCIHFAGVLYSLFDKHQTRKCQLNGRRSRSRSLVVSSLAEASFRECP